MSDEQSALPEKLIADIKWVGTSDATIKRITKEGITTIPQLLAYTPIELAEKIGSEVTTVEKVIHQAMKEYGLDYRTGTEVAVEQSRRTRISTGSKTFDTLLGGGVEGEVLTEFIAAFHGGKTQLCKTLGVIAVNQPSDEQGRLPHVVYIDCENTFKADRVKEIAKARGYDPEKTLSRFLVATAYNSEHEYILIKNVDKILTDNYVVLMIVDGILSHLRGEYVGRENLSPRQGRLGAMTGKLLSIAGSFKIPVVVTNQVQGNVTGYGKSYNPAGGHVMGHACTHRIMLTPRSKNIRMIQVIDSPSISDDINIRVAITAAGIVDEDGSFELITEDEDVTV